MTVDELMTRALLLFMQNGKEQGLDYVSRSHTADMGWYFWLTHVSGVYEIELKSSEQDGNSAEFYLRYYPDTEEPVLEDYSIEEQLLRFNDDFFNDSEIRTDEEEHEECPCCSVPDVSSMKHEFCHCGHHDNEDHGHHNGSCQEKHRKVGIPFLVKKFAMNKKMFQIGTLYISTLSETGYKTSVDTVERLTERSEQGVYFEKDGHKTELVAPGGINRNVPGRLLADQFMLFFNRRLLATVN